jgi:transcriptional regulator with XRE-family HTH domain
VDEAGCREILARNVRRLAQKRGMSIERVADTADVSYSTLWKLLGSEHNATLRTLVKLAKALGCQPSELLAR